MDAGELAKKYLNNYGNSMLRFAFSYTRNTEDAEDVVQEALIRAISSNAVFENDAHEKAYLMAIVRNTSLNYIKKRDLHPCEELDENVAADRPEDLSYVREAVLKLPEHERDAIHLFYLEGYSTAEIAKIVKRREATVRSDLYRGREHLKGIIKEEWENE